MTGTVSQAPNAAKSAQVIGVEGISGGSAPGSTYVLQFGDVALGGHYRPGGVVVLKSNRVFGGDSGHYYVGTYTAEADSLTIDAKIVKHDPTAGNPFGDTSASFEVDARLTVGEKTMEGTMERRDRPGLQLPLRLIWKEDLP